MGKSNSNSNPFDLQITREKFPILGKRKDKLAREDESNRTSINISKRRDLSRQKRSDQLGSEYRKRNKSGYLADHRVALNSNISKEDKMMRRLMKQRTKDKKSKFQLDDDENLENEEEIFTHGGKTLLLDDYEPDEAEFLNDDQDDIWNLDRDHTSKYHFGGGNFINSSDANKSKAEVMEELIGKSKFYKAERQKNMEEQQDLLEKLDFSFNKELEEQIRNSSKHSGAITLDGKSLEQTHEVKEDDEYDLMIRQLKYDSRAKATNRKLTVEEIAKGEREKLENYERERLKRMRNEEEEDSDDDNDGIPNSRKKTKVSISGDALSGDFDIPGFGIDEEDNVSVSSEEEVHSASAPVIPKSMIKKSNNFNYGKSLDDVPFTLKCPSTIQEMDDLFSERDGEQIQVILDRILKSNSPSLGPQYVEPFQNFFQLCWNFIYTKCDVEVDSKSKKSKKGKTPLEVFERFVFRMCDIVSEFAYEYFATWLELLQEKLFNGIISGKTKQLDSSKFDIKELYCLRLLTLIYSKTDFQNPITTPIAILCSEYLSQIPIRSYGDIVTKLYLCALLLEHHSESERYIPEVLIFLVAILELLFDLGDNSVYQFSNLILFKKNIFEKCLETLEKKGKRKNSKYKFSKFKLTDTDISVLSKSSELTEFWNCVFYSTLLLCSKMISSFSNLPAAAEFLAPLVVTLSKIPKEISSRYNPLYDSVVSNLRSTIKTCVSTRTPLNWQQRSFVKSIPQFNPAFQENYIPGDSLDRNDERDAHRRLEKKVRREKKAVERELRRDNEYLANERLKQKLEARQARKQANKEILGWLQGQQADTNAFKKVKGKLKGSFGVL